MTPADIFLLALSAGLVLYGLALVGGLGFTIWFFWRLLRGR
jgi:nitrate reductase NapE component